MLLVEDEPSDVRIATRELESITWATVKVAHVSSLEEATAYLEGQAVHAVVTDLGLADSWGLETVRAIAARDDTPLLVLTGVTDPDLAYQAISLGADSLLSKERPRGELARALRAALARRQTIRSTDVLVRTTADAMVVVDEDGTVLFANPAAEALFECKADQLVGDFFAFPIDTEAVTEVQVTRAEDVRTAEMRTLALNWEGRPAFLTVLRDISHRKLALQYERQLVHAERLAAIGQLAAGVAHEINNPATFVATNLKLLRERVDELLDESGLAGERREAFREEMRELFDDSDVGVERIAATVRELGMFSRTEERGVEPLDVAELVRTSWSMASHQVRHRAEVEVQGCALRPVLGDAHRLSQLLINLLLNAAQALESEARSGQRGRILIDFFDSNDDVVIAVEDNGPGIAPEHLDSIFMPFFTTKASGKGTGLGLSICADTARRYGGSLTVSSQVGKGTRFELRLPAWTGEMSAADEPAAPPPATTAADAAPSPRDGGRHRVLVIDDEDMLRAALTRVLRPYEVVGCASGREAIALVEAGDDFDAVVCDMMMPGLDGAAVHDALSELRADLAGRMIFMTGGALTARTQDFLEQRTERVLRKPVDMSKLKDLVASVVTAPAARP